MKYDFTTVMDRKGRDAIAVDEIGGFGPGAPKEGFDPIPMWVADMNFPTCPAILHAVEERLHEAHFGYFRPRQEYYGAIIRWHRERNGVTDLTEEAIGYENVYACNSGGHGWAEIEGKVYDPEWGRHHDDFTYFGLSYDNNETDVNYKRGIAPKADWMHIKIELN